MSQAVPASDPKSPPAHNLTNVNYRDVPPRKISPPGGIIDSHNHTREPALTRLLVDVAAAYGVTQFYTMAPLEHVAPLKQAFPGQFKFVCVPAWKPQMTFDDAFVEDWLRRIDGFHAEGSRLIKFHAAPGTSRRWQINGLDDARIERVAQYAYDRGFNFMTHIGDPKAWFYGNGAYAAGEGKPPPAFFNDQFAQLERMLEKYPDRIHLGAHMGGSLEDLDNLGRRLEKFPNYVIDTSATKWMVRAVAEQSPAAVRDFITTFQDRILFGSDIVVGDKYDWDYYASRYWAHLHLWENAGTIPSPIADPDAAKGFNPRTGEFHPTSDPRPMLTGVDLPPEVLQKLYRTNALRWLPG